MAKKIKKNEIFMKKQIKNIQDEQTRKYAEIDGNLFNMK